MQTKKKVCKHMSSYAKKYAKYLKLDGVGPVDNRPSNN